MTGRRLSVTVLLVALACVLAPHVAAGAPPGQTPPSTNAASGAPKLELVSQPPWVPARAGGDVPIALRASGNVPAGATVSVAAHQAATTRTGYENALQGKSLGSVLGTPDVPWDALPAAPDGSRTLTVGLQDPSTPRDASRLSLRRTGVYPLEVELRDANDRRIAGFVTPLVAVASGDNGRPLGVAWVWPLVAPPASKPDGSSDPAVVAQLRPDGRLGKQALALARHNVPVTLAPGPETVQSWKNLANDDATLSSTFAALRQLFATSQALAGPFVPIDVPSLLAGGFSPDDISAEIVQGQQTLTAVSGVPLDTGTAVEQRLNDTALARLRDAGIQRMIVDGSSLVPRRESLTPAQPFLLRSGLREVTAVASDDGLQRLLEGNDPSVLRAQRFLGGLAVIQQEQPNNGRGVVVLNPGDWNPDADLLGTVLAGLAPENPLIHALTVDQMIGTVNVATVGGESVVRQLASFEPAQPPVSEREYRAAQAQLSAFKSLVSAPNLITAHGDTVLLESLSSVWQSAERRAQARAHLGAIDLQVAQFLGRLRVPVNSTITLTANKGQIPVTFLNETNETLRVRVHLESDKLLFPDGSERELELPPRSTTVRFTVETRSSGTFPLVLKVTSPDGVLPIQKTDVRIRSTFVSHVGVYLTIGAGVFLALWWGNDFRRRRKRRAAAAAARPAAAQAGGA